MTHKKAAGVDASGLKCYYDEKKKRCSRSLSIPILYLAKMHHANYCSSISLIFLTMISHLNCTPLPDSVPVKLY